MSYTGTDGPAGYYATVAASQTAQVLGGNGNRGDYLETVVIVPTTTAAGAVTIIDGSTSIVVFQTGTLADLKPFHVYVKAYSKTGPWKITTGANVAVIAVGRFT